MAKNTTINLRVDSEVKEQAGHVLDRMGLTFSEAFNLLLHQITIQRALPFDVVSYNYHPYTPTREVLERIERIENGTAEMAGPFKTFEEYKAWLEADDDDDDGISSRP
jgi:addiction module RelB/DinJ family antitoxin